MLVKTLLEIDKIIRFAKTIEQSFTQDENLSLFQIEALTYISKPEIQTVTDLGNSLDTSPASASVLIERLVKKNLVYRGYSDSDRRKVHVSLTKYGLREYKRLEKKRQEVISDVQRLLSDDETLLLNKLFAKLTI
ncbi:MarR family transcriptional regulator [Fictibacillus nanhaiensis]|jgi:DNA-binding MarR family transcriptional regulator|uniref:MarR family winged helix-turn-helix transcriptional regulator n=1 Tax=Fictibacillus nanhaiensis TaxID=742169 RepID=UPI002042086F|nr:MarR family transcriptional regulator [Fictibacillus nanhaiensis]MCM3730440.1 MarR family transcriptional regulator [Fictibacillus nanhaiensis]